MQKGSSGGLLKRLFRGEVVPAHEHGVMVGARYMARNHHTSVWVVERISSVGSSTYPLVSLAREGHPDLKKTVSLAVIEEGEDFRPAI
ncbi:hypothetical protein [Kordiimonas aestuarii]|uniref:hypothetical protein n=1 Tax=Kordiimonas aestuarii TaxID=1005925 RepID=UPI0021D043A5|nr:hypothetical protein [Kordiimonas aestuarii]